MAASDDQTLRLAIFGDPVRQSRSPSMYNALFRRMSLNAAYSAVRVRSNELEQALEAVRRQRLAGVHLTCPHKERALPLMDELTPEAERAGAVNVAAWQHGRLVGDNTDGHGFVIALHKAFGPDVGRSAALLGAGGSARAIAHALVSDGFQRVAVLNRTFARAELLAASLRERGVTAVPLPLSVASFQIVAPRTDLVIDATTPGPDNVVDQLPVDGLPDHAICCDINYHREDPPLLRRARERGLRTQTGLAMLAEQGALSLRMLLDLDVQGEQLMALLGPEPGPAAAS